jgi:anti-sigma factor RsiW
MKEMHPTMDQIVDYLHGELSAAEDAAMHAHLTGCRDCDERRAQEVAITEALRAHVHARERELPPHLVADVLTRVTRNRPPSLWEQLRAGLRPLLVLPVAAAVALAIYAGVTFSRGPSAPIGVDAGSYVDAHASLSSFGPFSDDAPPATLTSNEAAR